jgi:uncharacterized membrane protein
MKKALIHLFLSGILTFNFHFFLAFKIPESFTGFSENSYAQALESDLKEEAFRVLKSKCNSCHKKKNPFKVFSLKNMDKHAPKIYKQVFIYRRMPKGDEIKLTDEESQTLKKWLKSENIY